MVFTSTHLSLRLSLSSTLGLNPFKPLLNQVGSISVAGSPIKLQTSIKNLGGCLSRLLTIFRQTVIWNVWSVIFPHPCLVQHSIISHHWGSWECWDSGVGSRLDHCNALLAGTSVYHLARLKLVQNTLARFVAQKYRFDHITSVLSELCSVWVWLPVRHRINFKIAIITHWVLQFQQPSYLAALMPCYAPVQSIRSSSSFSICVPLRKTSKTTSRSFSSVASKIWNALPGHLSSIPTLSPFKRCLKHYFVLRAHPARHLVATRHRNISLFLIRHHLLPLHHSKIPCIQLNAFHLSAYD